MWVVKTKSDSARIARVLEIEHDRIKNFLSRRNRPVMKIASNICCNKRRSIYHALYEDHPLMIYYTLCPSIIGLEHRAASTAPHMTSIKER